MARGDKQKIVTLRFSVTELRVIDRAAAKDKLQRSTWIRQKCLLGAEPRASDWSALAKVAPKPQDAPSPKLSASTGKCLLCGASDGHKLACPSRQGTPVQPLTRSFDPDA
jgi:hypothetical protein